jgi:hypothetical protein
MILWERLNGDIVEVIEVHGSIRNRDRKPLDEYSGRFYRGQGQGLVVAADGHIVAENSGQILGEHSQL